MLLKPFEAGRYDDESVVVSNPDNGKQELFSDREYAIVKFLKQNESQSLLALLMPNIGIAKKTHVQQCLRVLTKLKRMGITDYFAITGRKPSSETATIEMPVKKEKIELTSLNTFAITMFGVAGRLLAPLRTSGMLGLVAALAAVALLLFPYGSVSGALREQSPSYAFLFFLAYVTASGAFCLRALVQGAFLRALGREILRPVFALYFPLLTLSGDRSGVNLLGHKMRAQLAILGLVTPLALSGIFTLLALVHALSPVTAFVGFSSCAAVTLLLACPFLRLDGAELIHSLMFRDSLEEKVSTQLRELFHARANIERPTQFAILLSAAWLFVWLDCVRSFWEMMSFRIAENLSASSFPQKGGGAFMALFLVFMAAMPMGILVFHHLRARAQRKRKMVVVEKDKVKDSLTFEERISALEKIPLFAYLNDQERLALLNEMQPAFYKGGDFLMHQGELGKEFFVLVKGHATAFYTDMKGAVMTLAELAEGDAFGEIALIDDVPRTASIVSEGGCIALVLRKDGFDRFAETLGSSDRVKAMVRLTSFFRRHPLFSKLSARDQAQLIDSFRFQSIMPGEPVSGDESFHVIYSGAVRVDTNGGEAETTLQPDDCFGYSNPLGARYVALEGTGLLTVAKDQFHNLIWEKLVEKPELFI
jgi:hypothetical protein